MSKTSAERSREYRNRLKEKIGENAFKRRAAEYQRKRYQPRSTLSKQELTKVREHTYAYVKKHRDGSRINTSSTPSLGQTHKRSRALYAARVKVKKLQELAKKHKKEKARLAKQCRRLQARVRKENKCQDVRREEKGSPSNAASETMKKAGIDPKDAPEIHGQLELHHAMMDEIRESCEVNKTRKTGFNPLTVVTGKVLKKHRLKARLKDRLRISRKHLETTLKLGKMPLQTTTRITKYTEEKKQVRAFFERDDNSTCLPGKADAKKVGKQKIQKRVLHDYMYNLHTKFLSEYPESKMSLTVFQRERPRHICLASFGTRTTCLCERHQNMALKVQCLKGLGITTTSNPDTFISTFTDESLNTALSTIPNSLVKFDEWQRKEVEKEVGRGKKKTKTTVKRCVKMSLQLDKKAFIKKVREEVKEFRDHCVRVQEQYKAVRELKKRIPANHAICQMNFAENYSCVHAAEVQSAYFDKESVTLHPVVIYYQKDGILEHASIVFISNTKSHMAGTVYAFIVKLMPIIHEKVPDLQMVHFVTDSPFSQYRNQSIFFLVSNHSKLFNGVSASWQYLEAGHGKGPCDGVGGTAKRMADDAVRQGKYTIQDAEDFYNWGKKEHKKIDYVYVSSIEVQQCQDVVSAWPSAWVKNTSLLHSVCSLQPGVICVRNTSCVCEQCFTSQGFRDSCAGWRRIRTKVLQ